MGLLNVSDEEWKAANYLLTGKPDGTKLKHQYSKLQRTYQYKDTDNQPKEIMLNHSFIVAEGQIWALPNATEKPQAFLGKGAFAKVSVRENQQGDTRLHRTVLDIDIDTPKDRLENIKKGQAIASDVGLIYGVITQQYYVHPGKRQGNAITIMSYDDKPIDLEKKYQQQQQIIPLTTAINTFSTLQKLHSGQLSKTGTAYLHRDIKLANIVESTNGKVMLIDYDFAVNKDNVDTNFCGTPLLIAPEIYSPTSTPKYSQSSDVYALSKALLIHELSIKFPQKYEEMMSTAKKIYGGTLPQRLNVVNQTFSVILSKLTKEEQASCAYLNNAILLDVVLKPKTQRPTIEQILKVLVTQQQSLQAQGMIGKGQLTIDNAQQNELPLKQTSHNIADINASIINYPLLCSKTKELSRQSNNPLNIIKSNLNKSQILSSTKFENNKNNKNDSCKIDKYSVPLTSPQKTNSSKSDEFEKIYYNSQSSQSLNQSFCFFPQSKSHENQQSQQSLTEL